MEKGAAMTDRKGMMYSGLIKCPFCAAENIDEGFIMHTQDCYLILKYIGAAKKKDLLAAWNRRPQEEALEEELRKLQKESHDHPRLLD